MMSYKARIENEEYKEALKGKYTGHPKRNFILIVPLPACR